MSTEKPNIVISKCIEFENCRYNGEIIRNKIVVSLKNYVNFIPVCPEVEIGLGVPRNPVRLVENNNKIDLFQISTEKIFTEKMIDFSNRFLSNLSEIDGFILKNSSPSCGINNVKIYRGFSKSASVYKGIGIFASEVYKKFPDIPIEDEGRLTNLVIRDLFFTRIFTLARFREIKKRLKISELIEFHSKNKYLLMTFNESGMRNLGKILANQKNYNADEIFKIYEENLRKILKRNPTTGHIINTLEHCFGGVSKNLNREEKKFFLDTIEEYRDERIPLITLLHLIKSYAIRFNNRYLLDQTFLAPYPSEILDSVYDTSKNRKYF